MEEKMHYNIGKVKYYPKENKTAWNSRAYLLMSMNNRHFRDKESLKNILEWIGGKVSSCDLIVGDFLHRHNQQILYGYDEATAIETSLKIGDELVSIFNDVCIKIPQVKFNIRRISEFYEKELFSKKMKRFESLLINDKKFSESIENTINSYIKRQSGSKLNQETTLDLSKKYLLEELGVYEMLEEENSLINIYPGNQLPVLKEIVAGNLKGISEQLEKLQLIEIKFKKINPT